MRQPQQRQIYKKNRDSQIGDYVRIICPDFSSSDREFLISEIIKTYPSPSTGRSVSSIVAGMVYLLSKCPANTDRPLKLREVYMRYTQIDSLVNFSTFFSTISYLKEQGIQQCRVTCETILTTYRSRFLEQAQDWGVSCEEIGSMIDKALQISRDPKISKYCSGRSPFTVAAALIYLSRSPETKITQEFITTILGINNVSLRMLARKIKEAPDLHLTFYP